MQSLCQHVSTSAVIFYPLWNLARCFVQVKLLDNLLSGRIETYNLPEFRFHFLHLMPEELHILFAEGIKAKYPVITYADVYQVKSILIQIPTLPDDFPLLE